MEKIKQFGLSTYQAKTYDALLKEGPSTAHIISKISAVPTGKIYPILDSLVEKRFVKFTGGRPKMYIAIAPEVVFGEVLEKRQNKLEKMQQDATDLISNYGKLSNIKDDKAEDLVEAYLGHITAFSKSVILHNKAKIYWKTISRLTINKEHLDACSRAIKRGVKVIAITSPKETTPERVREWRRRGIEVRFLDELPFRLSIYDDLGIVFRFSHEKSKEYVGAHIRNKKLARGMNKFFDSLWEVAKKKSN